MWGGVWLQQGCLCLARMVSLRCCLACQPSTPRSSDTKVMRRRPADRHVGIPAGILRDRRRPKAYKGTRGSRPMGAVLEERPGPSRGGVCGWIDEDDLGALFLKRPALINTAVPDGLKHKVIWENGLSGNDGNESTLALDIWRAPTDSTRALVSGRRPIRHPSSSPGVPPAARLTDLETTDVASCRLVSRTRSPTCSRICWPHSRHVRLTATSRLPKLPLLRYLLQSSGIGSALPSRDQITRRRAVFRQGAQRISAQH